MRFFRIGTAVRYPKDMPYPIQATQRERAEKLGLTLRPSRNPDKKLDAIDAEGKTVSFGGRGYMDFYLWKRFKGLAFAKERRKAYKTRHQKTRQIRKRDGKYTPSFLADQILW